MKGFGSLVVAVPFLFVLTSSLPSAQAQEIAGIISGAVSDPSGRMIAGAVITVVDTDRGIVQRTLKALATAVTARPFFQLDAIASSAKPPGSIRLEAALMKNTRIGERTSMQFRVEATNAFNHTNLNGVGAWFPDQANFGKVTSARGSRTIQLGLKLLF